MKKIKYILVCLLIVIFFTVGCGEVEDKENPNDTHATKNYTKTASPKIIEYGEGHGTSLDEVYYYCVDKRTGVVYLAYDAYRRHAITVMLNRDGTPVTAEQLGIKY